MFGLGNLAGLVKEGNVPGSVVTYLSAAAGTALGAATGTTPLIIAAESAVGIKEGGRTGLVAVTVAGCFALSMFLAPFLQVCIRVLVLFVVYASLVVLCIIAVVLSCQFSCTLVSVFVILFFQHLLPSPHTPHNPHKKQGHPPSGHSTRVGLSWCDDDGGVNTHRLEHHDDGSACILNHRHPALHLQYCQRHLRGTDHVGAVMVTDGAVLGVLRQWCVCHEGSGGGRGGRPGDTHLERLICGRAGAAGVTACRHWLNNKWRRWCGC